MLSVVKAALMLVDVVLNEHNMNELRVREAAQVQDALGEARMALIRAIRLINADTGE